MDGDKYLRAVSLGDALLTSMPRWRDRRAGHGWAIVRAVEAADSAYGFPAARDLQKPASAPDTVGTDSISA